MHRSNVSSLYTSILLFLKDLVKYIPLKQAFAQPANADALWLPCQQSKVTSTNVSAFAGYLWKDASKQKLRILILQPVSAYIYVAHSRAFFLFLQI